MPTTQGAVNEFTTRAFSARAPLPIAQFDGADWSKLQARCGARSGDFGACSQVWNLPELAEAAQRFPFKPFNRAPEEKFLLVQR
jgi:hypothetical protein